MLGFRKTPKADVLSHWYTLVDHFNISGKEFYASVEQELKNREVPGVKMSNVTFSESGLFSANRLYFRMKRERLVFDICAAPFGTSYFFSLRFAELPMRTPWWRFIPLLLGAFWMWRAYDRVRYVSPSVLILSILIILAILFILWFVIRVIENSLYKESYYRQDTRLMYLEIVNAVVRQRVAECTSAKGITLLNIKQHSPLMDNLYRTTEVSIETAEIPAAVTEPVPA